MKRLPKLRKLSEAQVGDTVVIKFKVEETSTVNLVNLDSPAFSIWLNTNREVDEIISKPWEPKIGDTVFPDTSHRHAPYKVNVPRDGLTLVGIHFDPNDQGKRKWAVVAYKGDIPSCIYFEDLRDRPKGPLCAD